MSLLDNSQVTEVFIERLRGASHIVGTPTVTVLMVDASDNVLMARGATVPTDGDAGYATGCHFIDTDAGLGVTVYINEGSATSCDFNAVEPAGSSVTAVVAGNGMLGGGVSGSVTVDVGITIYNDTGGTLTKGTLVRVKGYTGTNGITVVKADADTNIEATHVVAADINNAASGSVYPVVTVTGLNTNGRTIGDAVYLDATAGGFAFAAPTGADQLVQQVGTVKVVNATTGEIAFFIGQFQALGSSFLQAQSVTMAKLARGTDGQIIVANTGADPAYVTMSGDATLSAAGALTIANNAVTLAKFGRSDAAGKIVIGQGAGADAQYALLSGDATMDGSGAVTIANAAVSPAKQTTAARTRVATISFSLPAPTGADQLGLARANFICSQALTIVSLKVVSTTATTGSDATNNYQFMGRNVTGAANLHTVTTTTNGGEIAANTPFTVTVSQNLSFTANQLFQLSVDIKDDGSAGPTNLSAADLTLIMEYTI